ncbi:MULTISPECIES: hypothetical protein [Achromobacter]|uniref:Uncharacterized protein n=1 Tax=Achromobacter spanius TaxID=217203 RepID=A0ABY8GRY8_9BURK|nr:MULTISPECIES: hypothetical protein [Achromobacter]WAI83154.1 hypothetical protein N8Z00_27265 [Achromobacter spanius]WEX93238.1 hypothetical protein N3Z32_21860 [Achromobacter sp. SS2-2022]WFP07605.1 hypothetical protein P8T11_25395 [Achromobacter spanius]
MTAVFAALAPGAALLAEPAPEVDLFPSQSWASLLDRGNARAQDDAADAATAQADVPALDQAMPAAPEGNGPASVPAFMAIGEWSDTGRRIVVLAHQDETYLLCQRCDIAGAVWPGGMLASQYRLKALEPRRVVLLDPQGRELNVDLAPLAQ